MGKGSSSLDSDALDSNRCRLDLGQCNVSIILLGPVVVLELGVFLVGDSDSNFSICEFESRQQDVSIYKM